MLYGVVHTKNYLRGLQTKPHKKNYKPASRSLCISHFSAVARFIAKLNAPSNSQHPMQAIISASRFHPWTKVEYMDESVFILTMSWHVMLKTCTTTTSSGRVEAQNSDLSLEVCFPVLATNCLLLGDSSPAEVGNDDHHHYYMNWRTQHSDAISLQLE